MNDCNFKGYIYGEPKSFGKTENNAVVRVKVQVKTEYEKNKEKLYRNDYIECVSFGDIAKDIEKNHRDGDCIIVNAYVQNRTYLDKDNKRIYTNDFIIRKIDSSLPSD